MRLYRRVIEIRDGYMALSPVDVPGIEETVRAAAGRRALSAADEATVTAATRLELARRAELRGEVRTLTGDPHAGQDFVAGPTWTARCGCSGSWPRTGDHPAGRRDHRAWLLPHPDP